ncbi:acyl-CoA thioester hydrolase/BAAT C-terminal domain-containing protein [Shewanella cyperi]|uniref:acyl-CoA thioester hydrolase/BAAT C-terminal domain-containing protein n=1 Tax=Shewanella cyperi TaxID=2814292 RepID=UPI001A93D4EB|nr:acyl-CoA thioester hydrolase/BAAT C-terminal domain-containing protein [Shewanella cyperi]QSX41751.1 dienelactone hydrolase family protein [Shewanella cyperi]
MHKFVPMVALIVSLLSFPSKSENYHYDIKKVEYKNLVANLYLPKTENKLPVVIAFGGSEGGIATGDSNGEMIAPHGVAVLGLAFFKEKGISQTLDQIPMEYFIDAIEYLESQPLIDSSRIGVVAGSRGSEAAFLLATMDSRIKSVVVTTPSKVAWYGLTVPKSAWTFKGQDIPALSLELDSNAKLIERFNVALENQENVNKALFKFENINGPLLMISAENDQIWPSYQMSKDIEVYLKDKKFKYPVTHNSYKTGHGFSKETAPEIKDSIINHFLTTL